MRFPVECLLVLVTLQMGCGGRVVIDAENTENLDPQDPTKIVALSSAASATCALRANGTVTCWGKPFEKPTDVAFAKAVEIAVGASRVCARLENGHVQCATFAINSNGPIEAPVEIQGIEDAALLSVGASHACVLRATGALVCWGDNTFGQIGDGTFNATNVPVPVGLGPIQSVSAGEFHTCALTDAGVFCWGRALDGQLGDGPQDHVPCTTIDTCSPSPVHAYGLSKPTYVSAGLNGTCAVDEGANVKCWGWHSAIDNNGMNDVPTDMPGVGKASDVFAGYVRACAYTHGSTIRCWGDNSGGALGNGTTDPQTSPVDVKGISDAIRVTGGWYHTCALRAGGEVLCWGDNGFGQLGDDTIDARPTPGPVPL